MSFLLNSLGVKAEPETRAWEVVPRLGWWSGQSETGKAKGLAWATKSFRSCFG